MNGSIKKEKALKMVDCIIKEGTELLQFCKLKYLKSVEDLHRQRQNHLITQVQYKQLKIFFLCFIFYHKIACKGIVYTV